MKIWKQSISAFLALCLLICTTACGEKTQMDTPSWQEQYDLGVRYLEEGNYEEAIIAFTVAIEIDPRAESYLGRGQAYMLSDGTKENLSAALADFETAVSIDDTLADAWIGLADVYIARGEYAKAQDMLNQAIDKLGELPDLVERKESTQNSIAATAIDILLAHEEMWCDDLMTIWDLWGNNFAYFMDLDIDGVPEFIVETPMMGSGLYTSRTIYQIQGKDLIVVKNNVGESDWDEISLWQDRQTREYFYIGFDNLRDGAEWYTNTWARLELQQGELTAWNLYIENVSDSIPTYYGADYPTAITEAEFERLQADLESRAEDLGVQCGDTIEEWNPDASQDEKHSILLAAYESAPHLRWALSEQVTDVTFTRYENGMYESAVIRGVDAAGIHRWSYTTGNYELAQLQRVSQIGLKDNLYYFDDNGTITALDLQSGQVAWKNGDGGIGLDEFSYAFDEDGTLYFCGYLGSDFCAIGVDGSTLKEIEQFNEDYYWPDSIELDGTRAIISFEMGPDGYHEDNKYQFYVDLNDWSYSLLE